MRRISARDGVRIWVMVMVWMVASIPTTEAAAPDDGLTATATPTVQPVSLNAEDVDRHLIQTVAKKREHISEFIKTTLPEPQAVKRQTDKLGEGAANMPGDAGNYECPDKKCKHGGTLQNCKCICINGWGGDLCQFCRIEGGSASRRLFAATGTAVTRGSIPSSEATDRTALGEGAGRRRKKKGKKPPSLGGCKRGSLDAKTCSCTCNADWSGLQCDVCRHAPCKNGGTLDPAKCGCNCNGNWAGKFCEVCTITGSVKWKALFDVTTVYAEKKCRHGQFKPATCSCSCDPDWAGNLCGQCVHPACGVAGELDPLFCRCNCVPAWTGKTCQICLHPFCRKAPVDPANCAWVKQQLGCPSIGDLPAQPERKKFPKEPMRTIT